MTPEILSSLGLVVPFSSRGDDGTTVNWFPSHIQAASAWHTCSLHLTVRMKQQFITSSLQCNIFHGYASVNSTQSCCNVSYAPIFGNREVKLWSTACIEPDDLLGFAELHGEEPMWFRRQWCSLVKKLIKSPTTLSISFAQAIQMCIVSVVVSILVKSSKT